MASFKHNLLGISLFLSFIILFTALSTAASCWTYTESNNESCTSANGCFWKVDDWGSWCEELNCWSLNTQDLCSSTNVPGKNCSWSAGGTSYSCTEINCWSFDGPDQSACETNSAGKSCTWVGNCYNVGPGDHCYALSNQATCLNSTGCQWGECRDKSCDVNTDSGTCNSAKDWRGNNCTWSSGNYCKENNCWDTSLHPNKTACEAAQGIACEWKWNSCQEKTCYSFDGNQTGCTVDANATYGLDCTWDGSYCYEKDCWSLSTNATCSDQAGCLWDDWTSSGWCEEVNCWTWDSIRDGNETSCHGNGTLYDMDCVWTNQTDDGKNGWCDQDYSTLSCSNQTTERDCMDTYYCWWQANNWALPTAGGNCTAPTWGTGDYANLEPILNTWNPSCYIFDTNETRCNQVLGCNYTNSECIDLNDTLGGRNLSTVGITCYDLNNSDLCNNMASLSTCCSWSNSSCTENNVTNSCFNNLKQTPNGEISCEDAPTKSDCDEISGDPWYMPCSWDNSSIISRCTFKAQDVFGNTSHSIVKIENKRNCQAAGGKWITENYCEGTVAVATGRCEYKFDDERDCDKACFACEIETGAGFGGGEGIAVNITNAKSACQDSLLGFCQFNVSTNAPNGIGYCKAKEEWRTGNAGNCDSSCGDCTYKGDPINNDTTKRPSYYCEKSKANPLGGGCKWIADNSTGSQGFCLKKGDLTCLDSCDRCDTRSECANDGRSALANKSGSCKWQGTDNEGDCVANIAGDVEVCWNGEDDNSDGLIDCADPGCYSDSFCGFVTGDCFVWSDTNITLCQDAGCEWVADKWGNWCDFNGSQCWKKDNNESSCSEDTYCGWNNGTGTGNCEQDWSIAENCFGTTNETGCFAISDCAWQNDTWCDGFGNGSEWCNTAGGWCDHTSFASNDCWQNYDNASCTSTAGCNWRKDEWTGSQCDVNWSTNCWNNNHSNSCENSANCQWVTDPWGSWCDNKFGECWRQSTQATCSNVGSKCTWKSYGTGSGSCEPSCYNSTAHQASASCTAIPGCIWEEDSGWCEEQQSQSCFNGTLYSDETLCGGTSGCVWNSPGWCNPKDGGFSASSVDSGGGKGGAAGADCYRFDGDETLCTDKSVANVSCGWFVEPSPFCEVDWNDNCWQNVNITTCNAGTNCWWKNDTYGSYCVNAAEECWNNATLNTEAACDANDYCSFSNYGCQPSCFNATISSDQTLCAAATGCKWVNGWCNPSGLTNVFDGIEAGAPVPLGADDCGETGLQKSVDICGFGLKDMGDSYGFGIMVNDFSNASTCNKVKISSTVAGYAGGDFGPGGTNGTEQTGSGNETVKFIVYLDTDGLATGGCSLSHNATTTNGYEFKFRYASEWSLNKSKAIETFTAYECKNSKWKTTDVKLSTWKKLMCSEIGGAMIAVEKSDLARFPLLYDPTKDMRVFVSTIGLTGNGSYPSDIAGPSYTTPGSVDFAISGCFDYGADAAKFEDILRLGYVQGEDCFNSIDDDADGTIDCNDWDCQFSSKCTSSGVNAAGFTDTKAPQVTGVKIEEYPDSALVIYDTNKPANGTLEFYGTDSRCITLNSTIYDVGTLKSNVRNFKSWHKAEIYNDSGTTSMRYDLLADTSYYYKLKVCDDAAKCAISKCSSFTTAASAAKCGYCGFVTRIKVPTGWDISYDINQDGTYEHVQGQVCGDNAGLKTNYTIGRKVDIKLNKTDGSTYIEFFNASLTKSALNDKVRTISGASDLISTSTIVGLTSSTRDKIINNLHPEVCRVKIPFSGTCDSIFHCDDDGANCVDRTSSSTLIDSTNCIWQLPFCEFSTYREAQAPSGGGDDSSSSTSGGGGGGGGGVATTTNDTTPTTGTTPEAESPTTDDEETQLSPKELEELAKSKTLFGIIIAIVVIAALVIGGGIYWKKRK